MKYLALAALVFSLNVLSKEKCLDEEQYRALIENLKNGLEPSLRFESYLEQVQVLSIIRSGLEADGNKWTIDFIDETTNSYLLLIHSFVTSSESIDDFHLNTIRMLVKSILSAREKHPSSHPNDIVMVLSEDVGIAKQ